MATKILFNFNSISISLLILIFLTMMKNSYSREQRNIKHFGTEEFSTDYILCRICGADLADAKYIINQLSPFAKVIINQTLFEQSEVEVQILKNPVGIEFQSITVSNSICVPVHNWHQNFSWYPGYVWRPCICKQCRTHHGWIFEPIKTAMKDSLNTSSNKGFFVLKLYNLLSEHFADSLIVIPKSYMS